MARFNDTRTRVVAPDTVNLAGGQAHQQTPKLELASLVTTNFVTDQYYRGAGDSLARLRELEAQVDPLYAAKAAVYARNEDGLRSITHALAAEIVHDQRVKGEQWVKRFLDAVVRRPDDATEILAYYLSRYGKPLPNALKKGLGSALGKFDEYQLAKYRGEGRDFSLVDLVNLVHPRPTEKNAEALKKLVNGELRSTGTFESTLSKAGPSKEAKAEGWRELLESRKIGYFALLKNLRNIAEQAPELVPVALNLLRDEKLIRNSLVLPFRYLTAARQLSAYPEIVAAISDALDIALVNVPKFDNSVVWIDGSGSMGGRVAGNDHLTRLDVAALFGAVVFKKSGGDVGLFESDARLISGLNPRDSTFTIAEQIKSVRLGYATNFHAIFDRMTKPYENVIIFSDMQGWVGYNTPAANVAAYRRRVGANPHIFSFDLAGYGSLQFPERKTYALAGFSDKTFGLMENLRVDPGAFVKKIEAVEF